MIWYKAQWYSLTAPNVQPHTCDLTHRCEATTVNHRCHCGDEHPPDLTLSVAPARDAQPVTRAQAE